MSAVSEPAADILMTTDELLALPDDGIDRELIGGQLREKPITKRNPRHSRVQMKVGHILFNWLDLQPEPRGQVLGGEAGFRLRRNPDTTVGVDVAYVSAETMAGTPEDAALVEGPPLLAVELLSPSDKQEEIYEKVKEYLRCGVPQVWIIDPFFQTLSVHRPGEEPLLFNIRQEFSADPILPGLSVKVADIFAT